MRRWIRNSVVPWVLLGAAAAAPAQEANGDRIRIVAIDGESADGIPSDRTLSVYGNRDAFRIAADGTVLFDGDLSDGSTLQRGFFLGSGGTVTPLLLAGDAAPDPYGSLTVAGTTEVRMSRSGNVAVSCSLSAAASPAAVATIVAGTRRTRAVARESLPGGTLLASINSNAFGYNADTLVLLADVGESPDPQRAGYYRLVAGGAEELLAEENAELAGVPGSKIRYALAEPVVHENGSALFTLLMDDFEFGSRTLLAAFPPPGQGATATVLGRTRDVLPDVGEVFAIAGYTFGRAASPDALPRIVYALGGSTGSFVYDTAVGAAPILGPTTLVDGNHPVLTHGRRIGLAPCDDGSVVVVGDSAGPDFQTGNIDGVWRWTPGDAGPTVALELREGQPFVDANGLGTTVQQIYAVHVNDGGRVAAEVQFPQKQAILLQDVAGGPFRVALQQGNEFVADGRAFMASTFIGQIPTTFSFTGPGHDGRQSRFSPAGDLVFRGGSFNTGTGVFVLGSDAPDGCNVTARVRGRDLVIDGDDCGARLTVRVSLGGEYFLRPGTGTLVNGFEGEVTMNAPGGLRVSLGAGADDLTIESAFGGIPYGSVAGDIVVDAGAGDDRVTLSFVESGGSVRVSMGNDAGLQEWLTLHRLDVGRDLRVSTSPTKTYCEIDGAAVLGRTTVRHGGGQGSFYSTATGFQGTAKFTGGPDADTFQFDECLFYGDVAVDLKEGILGSVRFTSCEGTNADVRIEGRRSGSTSYTIEDCFLHGGSARVTSGTLGSGILFDRTSLGGDVDVRTSGVGTTSDLVNTIYFGNSFADHRVRIRGKGNHTVSVGSSAHAYQGLDIRLKGGIYDTISVTKDMLVNSGGVRIQTNAAQGARIIVDDLEVVSGTVEIRGSGGDDHATVQYSDFNGAVKMKMGNGNDRVEFLEVIAALPVLIDGGPGTDDLTFSGDQIHGGLRQENHETSNIPAVLPPSE